MGIRAWQRGMSFRFIFRLRRHQLNCRGMSFRFIFFRGKQHQDCRVAGGELGLGPGTGACCLRSYFSCGGSIRTLWLGACTRIRTRHRGLSFRFILRLRRHQVIGGDARMYKGDTRRGGEVQQDARRSDMI